MPNRCFRYTSSLLALLILGSAHPARAGSEKGSFELVGKLVAAEPGMFKTRYPAVTLSRVDTAFATRTVADGNGQFKFKRLRAGMYTLVAALPQVRVLRKTVDIGPSFADAKGRIFLSIPFERQAPRRRYTVSATVLAIPDDAQAEYRKAHDYLGKGEPERATACLKKAVEIAPQFAGAWNSLGNIAFQSGRLEEAEAYYREALTLNPGFYRALISLGSTLISQGKSKESLDAYYQAVKLRPEDPEGQARLGLNYLQLGEFDQALQHLREVKRIDPGHFSFPQLFLAQIYTRREDRAAAILELEEFLKLHPDSDMVPAARESIQWLRGR